LREKTYPWSNYRHSTSGHGQKVAKNQVFVSFEEQNAIVFVKLHENDSDRRRQDQKDLISHVHTYVHTDAHTVDSN
jgi:predicted amidophosphoribosyltransferase